jgi:hypothetical protein
LTKFIEQDTDIYKESINVTKKTELTKEEKQDLPIFYIDKSFQSFEQEIFSNISQEDNKLNIEYHIDSNKFYFNLNLPLTINLSIREEKELGYNEYKWLINFIDKSYLQISFEKTQQKNNIVIQNFDINFILRLLEENKIKIKYDDKIKSPTQLQKLLIKTGNTLILKIVNKIKYLQNTKKYEFKESINQDDYVSEYDVKFTLTTKGIKDTVTERLEKDESFKIFTERIFNHYYKPLAIDPNANTKDTYDAFKECGYEKITQNFDNIFVCYEEYFENVESIKIFPDKLDPYEFKFLCDLQKYIKTNSLNATILRNKSNGNIGIISSEDNSVFYPDFIIWYEDEKSQKHLIFCDPKGIRNAETKWKVCDAPYEVKKIEKQWNNDIKIHSFVISNTKLENVPWSPIKDLDLEKCDNFYNLVFFEDDKYIDRIFKGLDTDILLHQSFKKYLEFFDKETIEEWLDDKKREKHLEIIKKIEKEEDNIDKEKAIVLYFIVWDKKDKIETNLKQELSDDLKEQVITEVLDEFLPEIILDSIPYARTALKLYKLIKK